MKSLTDEELLQALRRGITTKLKDYDTKPTSYCVIDFCDETDELLICYGGTGELWRGDSELSYCCHTIKGKDKGKTWTINK